MKIYLILLVTIVSLTQGFSQETGAIRGKIVSSDGFALSGISLIFDTSLITKSTNNSGEFYFENFPIGLHTITLEGIGLKKQFKEIKVVKNEITIVEFILEDSINTLQEVLIFIIESPNKKKESIFSGLDIKPIDLPQSIQIIGNSVIQQQQTLRLSEVIKNVNGVYVGSARGGAQESFWSRGYDMSANNMFKNGFRMTGGSMPEVATLEKIEILKGGSALLFGNVTPGGILNMVTKSPSFKKGVEVNLQTGSYSFYKPTFDSYGPLNKKIAYRIISTYENAESFREIVKRERFYINPSLFLKMNIKTELTIQVDYLNDYWTPDFGTGSIGKQIANVPRSVYLGATWSKGNTQQSSASVLIKHKFNSNWKLNFNSSLQNFKRIWEGTERIQPNSNGDWNRPLGKYKLEEQLIGNQLNLQGNFTTGKIKHQLFTGVDADKSIAESSTFSFNPTIYDTINIFNFDYSNNEAPKPDALLTNIVTTTSHRFGIVAQDLITITEKLKVLAGLRWSWQESQPITLNLAVNQNATTRGEKQIDNAFSPKIGLVFQPTKNMSLFTSYSNSFQPNSGVTSTNELLKPSIIDQYEIGIKKDFCNGRFSSNITAYSIVNSNLAQQAEFKADGSINTDSNVKNLSGETTSKGIEIDLSSKPIEGLTILAGYSYNDMRFSKTSGAIGGFITGERLTRTPKNTANFSLFYTFQSGKMRGISLGTVSNYIGNRIGGWNNTLGQSVPDRTIPLSGYAIFDISVGYKWKKVSVLCKLSNVSNALNYTVHENYSFNPIAPRQVLTSINYQF
jgi:iron complex outermembrane receptor protein